MSNMPSLKALRAFEVAARTGSFAAAARELSVSAAAIGQLVRALEDQVGRALFYRVKRKVIPTEAGFEVLPRLTVAFDELQDISQQITGASSPARLTISAPESVMTGWLSQCIDSFILAQGTIDLSLRCDNDPVNFDGDRVDIRLSYGQFYYRTHNTSEIITDAIYPVCSPGFMQESGPFTSAEALLHTSLIHTDWGPTSASYPTWRNWFESARVSPGQHTDHGLVANSSMMAINLARNGLGVALCQGLLVAHLIEKGALVQASRLVLPQTQAYCLTIPQRSANRPIVALCQTWMRQVCQSTVSSVHLHRN
ncbi:MAG: LysR family transcriptional regulator [Gammaproteobacteria bacterium]|nr:LysR family transcriptional regulator [Gammaproteobacteria bacterium]